jgi:hypothetical protein
MVEGEGQVHGRDVDKFWEEEMLFPKLPKDDEVPSSQ